MKLVGLIGGTSWPSTMLYYEKLNTLIANKLGGSHSARILLYSIDYHDIKSSYSQDWKLVETYLESEIKLFLNKKPECLIICNNTLHKAFDKIKDNLNLQIPVFHAGFLAAKEAVKNNYKSVLLLGTKFTMEDGFFAKYFEDLNVKVIIPNQNDRDEIQNLQSQIASGVKNNMFYESFKNILERYKNCDVVCLACTELPIYINKTNCNLPIINPIDLQCQEAVKCE